MGVSDQAAADNANNINSIDSMYSFLEESLKIFIKTSMLNVKQWDDTIIAIMKSKFKIFIYCPD